MLVPSSFPSVLVHCHHSAGLPPSDFSGASLSMSVCAHWGSLLRLSMMTLLWKSCPCLHQQRELPQSETFNFKCPDFRTSFVVLHVKARSLKVFCECPTTLPQPQLLVYWDSLSNGVQASFELMIHCYFIIRQGRPHWALKLLSSNRSLHRENSTLSPSEIQPENNSAFKRL